MISSFLFSWCSPLPLALTFFLLPLPQHFLSSEGKDLMDTLCLGMSRSSHIFHSLQNVLLRVSIFVPIWYRRKWLWLWLNKALIYEYSRIALWVSCFIIVLLLFSFVFFRPVAFRLNLDHWTIQYHVFGHPNNIGYGSYLIEWTTSQISYWMVITTNFVPPL